MITNTNPATGIPFGYIRADSIDSELLDQLLYTYGKDLSYDSALADHLAEKRREFEAAQEDLAIQRAETGADRENPDVGEDDPEFDEDAVTEEFADAYQCDEPVYEGEHEGVKYRTSWLGGAMNLWVFESPVVTRCRPCSPCVPGAGDLDSVGDYEAYGVPTSWLDTDFVRDQCEKADFIVSMDDDHGQWFWRNDEFHGGLFGTTELAFEDCYKTNLQRKLEGDQHASGT